MHRIRAIRERARFSVLPYLALALVFVAAAIYLARSTYFTFPHIFPGADPAREPFVVGSTDRPGPIAAISFPEPEAVQAGLKQGDLLVAINGQPISGMAVFGEAVRQHRPGDTLTLDVLSTGPDGNLTARRVALRLAAYGHYRNAAILFILYLSPYFCFALGFWVAAARPRDARAWFLLLLLLGFSSFFNPRLDSWGPVLRDYGLIYRDLLTLTIPIWLLALGIYFPEPFPRTGRSRLWYWLEWFVIVPLSILTIWQIAAALGALENVIATSPLRTSFAALVPFTSAFGYFSLALFPVCMIAKWRTAVSRDSRRRLRLLALGSIASLGPLLILSTIATATNHQVELYFPRWLYLTAYLLLCLFPITLSYVIVVQRAMDVRVVLRQGLQYALARRGVRITQIVVTAAVIYAAVTLSTQSLHRPQKITILALGIAAVFVLRRGAEGLRRAIDRRFFRDAYNAEQILTDLGERVRTIVETRPLLETVVQRISESLHVPRIAALIDGSGPYLPAYALGFTSAPDVTFSHDAATIQQLRQLREPLVIYRDDPNSWINRARNLDEEERLNLATLQSELLLPFLVNEKLLGFLSLGQKLSEEPYSGTDLRLLKSVAAQTGLALEVARLTNAISEEIAQRERLNREVEIAREVQEHLFPQALPAIAGLEYCGRCRPALGVGGDYFDFVALPFRKLGIAIGDVSGKGISAALMMASLQAALRSQAAAAAGNLAELISRVNAQLYQASTVERYATLFYAEYDPQSCSLAYVNAGHNPPLVLRPNGGARAVMRLEAGGTVVGLLPESSWEPGKFQLQAGDLFVAFTDGISEAMNRDDELWGEQHLMDVLNCAGDSTAAEIISRIISAVDTFVAGAKQSDDMTLIVARVI
jgi:phosphoserine phosphatase RsbU/P